MELRQLRYFVAVAELRSFARASERLYVVEPALSRQIKNLEQELGCQLFIRDGRSIRLADSAKALLPQAQMILAQCERFKESAIELCTGARGLVQIGTVPQFMGTIVRDLAVWFRDNRPEIELRLMEDRGSNLPNMLRSGEVDLIFGFTEELAGLSAHPLYETTAAVLVPLNHRLAVYDRIEITQLADEPITLPAPGSNHRELFLTACRKAGLHPRILTECSSSVSSIPLAQAGLGLPLLSDQFNNYPPDLKKVALMFHGEPLRRTAVIAWEPRLEMSVAVRFFIDKAIEFADARKKTGSVLPTPSPVSVTSP